MTSLNELLLSNCLIPLRFKYSITGIFSVIMSNTTLEKKDIANLVIKQTNSKSEIKNLPWRSGEKGMKLSLSIEKAKRDFGYTPKISFEEGIEKTVNWMRSL